MVSARRGPMDNEGMRGAHAHSRPWSAADWRRTRATDPTDGDRADNGLISGALDEQRSFGARATPVSLGHVVLRETRGPHEVWAHTAGRDLAITQLTPQPCRGHL